MCVCIADRTPRIDSFRHVPSADALTLACITSVAPPAAITWTRDGEELVIDGTINQMIQEVTSRTEVTYRNMLLVRGDLDNVPGVYRCSINGTNQSPVSRTVSIQGT